MCSEVGDGACGYPARNAAYGDEYLGAGGVAVVDGDVARVLHDAYRLAVIGNSSACGEVGWPKVPLAVFWFWFT